MHKPKKFKIARRLGPAVFDQTQTERFALSEARKKKGPVKDKHKKSISQYNLALRDKQRVRFYYGVSESQFSRYVKESGKRHDTDPALALFRTLETRLDNIAYRAGLAPTHRAARQMVSHGHVLVNGKKIRVASHIVSVGDVITIRPGSTGKKIFGTLDETLKEHKVPDWLAKDEKRNEWKIAGLPSADEIPPAFNFASVVHFYSRA